MGGGDFSNGQKSSNLMAFSGLIKPFVGVGVLSLPAVAMHGGFIQFSLLLVILTFVASWCIFKLVDCGELMTLAEARRNMYRRKLIQYHQQHQLPPPHPQSLHSIELFDVPLQFINDQDTHPEECDYVGITQPSFTDIGNAAYGYWGGFITDLCILITQLGGCAAYFIFVSGTLADLTGWNRILWVFLIFIPFVGISVIKDMSKLATISSLGNLVYIYTLIVLFYHGMRQPEWVSQNDRTMFDISYFALVFGTLSFALEGIVTVGPLKRAMATPKSFPQVMAGVMFTIFLIYFIVGNGCYLFFGLNTKSPVILNLTAGLAANSVKIALCISIYITFGLQVFPITSFFDTLLDEKYFKLDWVFLKQEYAILRREQQIQEQYERYDDNDNNDPNNPSSNDTIATNLNPNDTLDDIRSPTDSTTIPTKVQQTLPGEDTHHNNVPLDELVPTHLVQQRKLYQNLHRILFVTFCAFIAIVFPQFHLIIALFGSFSNALLAYVLPALYWCQICTPYLFTGLIFYPFDRNGSPLHDDKIITPTTSQNGMTHTNGMPVSPLDAENYQQQVDSDDNNNNFNPYNNNNNGNNGDNIYSGTSHLTRLDEGDDELETIGTSMTLTTTTRGHIGNEDLYSSSGSHSLSSSSSLRHTQTSSNAAIGDLQIELTPSIVHHNNQPNLDSADGNDDTGNDDQLSDQFNVKKITVIHSSGKFRIVPWSSDWNKASVFFLPYIVGVLGIASSLIGVTFATKELIAEFFK